MPHVAFLHERFLFRFGHDRTMLLHGRELVRRGWTVTFVGLDADADVIASIGARLLLVPHGASSYETLDVFACNWLQRRWFALFPHGAPDVVVNGGWPFYAFNGHAERLGAAAVVFDAGATPLEGVPLDALPVQLKLQALRRAHIREARRTVGVSVFICGSQTRADAPFVINHVVRNGADHIVEPLWPSPDDDASAVRATLARAREGGRRAVLHLGRWEEGYKNKAGALAVLRRVRARHAAALVVLADGDGDLPDDLREHVVFGGHPGDAGLRVLMAESDVGVSASLWEGFNLPLAEMLYLGRPAYALNVGAHSEVVPDPSFVRVTLDALADGVCEALEAPLTHLSDDALGPYRARLAWSLASGRLEDVLHEALAEKRATTEPRYLALDVTNASRDPANSGVVRVTRQLARALQPLHRLLFLTWDETLNQYRTLHVAELEQLSSFGGPECSPPPGGDAPVPLSKFLAARELTTADLAWLCPETVLQPRAAAVGWFFEAERIAFTAVLHDLIPQTHPQFCAPEIVAAFPAYRRFLQGARTLLANSHTTAEAWMTDVGHHPLPRLEVEPLPGDVGPRGTPKLGGPADPVRILTVSTFEPRKNHATLLKAFALAKSRVGGRRLELHLVGGGYAGDGGVLAHVRQATAADGCITLHGLVDDAALERLYGEADFTVYPSLWEGYGLPLAESLHRARPFICSDRGSMAEIAACGAGLTCDVSDVGALADAMARLTCDDALRARLGRIAALTPVRRWDEYALACLKHALHGRPATPIAPSHIPPPRPPGQVRPGDDMDWNSLLYPGKPVAAWQMSDSERMALTGLLARRLPKTYLEIGTYFGGSALLASEFADWVITIDIDPEAGERFSRPENITFMHGRSQDVLPDLLGDLLARDLYPEFVLIDGDHSAEGVRRDMEIFLKIRPPSPLIVVFHDSFNPVCRSGIRTAPWADCPYVSRLDLDFVPGRLVEIAGDPFGGEMWGGLAVAVLTPEPQPHPFLTATAEAAFQRTLPQSAHANAA